MIFQRPTSHVAEPRPRRDCVAWSSRRTDDPSPALLSTPDATGEPPQSSGGTRRPNSPSAAPDGESPKVGDYRSALLRRPPRPASMTSEPTDRGQAVPSEAPREPAHP